jgi:hypothetical protein
MSGVMNMNKLTERLLAEGYTKDNHPDYVRWVDYRNEFEYTQQHLYKTVWEAPCGIMRKGYFTHGYLCYGGVEWRPENDNYNFYCPYHIKECKHFHPLLRDAPLGAKCAWRMTNKPYNYNNSAEKIKDEREELIKKNLKKRFGYPGMIHCACCHIDEDTCEPYFDYDPADCIRFTRRGCDNEVCYCTGKKRNLEMANIYYDVKITTEYRKGFICEPEVRVVKGEKLFETRKPKTDLEIYLKLYPDAPLEKEKGKTHHTKGLFFAKHHGERYDLEIENVRIEKRETRDLLQDLQDIKEGMEVVHASDLLEAKRQAKKENKEKRQANKKRRIKQRTIENLKRIAHERLGPDGEEVSETLIRWAEGQLKKRGIGKEPEQISMI